MKVTMDIINQRVVHSKSLDLTWTNEVISTVDYQVASHNDYRKFTFRATCVRHQVGLLNDLLKKQTTVVQVINCASRDNLHCN